jgi:hypothetical protein
MNRTIFFYASVLVCLVLAASARAGIPQAPSTEPSIRSSEKAAELVFPSAALLKGYHFSKIEAKENHVIAGSSRGMTTEDYGKAGRRSLELLATRRDGLQLRIAVCIAAAGEDGMIFVRVYENGMAGAGGIPAGNPSGRKIAQATWQTIPWDGTPVRGGFDLIAYDGRSYVLVRLRYPLTTRDSSGDWIEAPVTLYDRRMAETFAVETLRKLTELGLTTRSTSAQKASAEKREKAAEAPTREGAS